MSLKCDTTIWVYSPKFILLDLPNGAGNRILSVGDDPGREHVYISVCARVV